MKRLFGLIVLAIIMLSSVGCAVAFDVGQTVPQPAVIPQVPAGQVYSVSLMSTISGLGDCLQQVIGTAIIAKDNSIIFVWRLGDGFAVTGFNTSKEVLKEVWSNKANMINAEDMHSILSDLLDGGWKFIDPREVPAPVVAVISSTAAKFFANRAYITFLVVPAGYFDPDLYGVVQYNAVNE